MPSPAHDYNMVRQANLCVTTRTTEVFGNKHCGGCITAPVGSMPVGRVVNEYSQQRRLSSTLVQQEGPTVELVVTRTDTL